MIILKALKWKISEMCYDLQIHFVKFTDQKISWKINHYLKLISYLADEINFLQLVWLILLKRVTSIRSLTDNYKSLTGKCYYQSSYWRALFQEGTLQIVTKFLKDIWEKLNFSTQLLISKYLILVKINSIISILGKTFQTFKITVFLIRSFKLTPLKLKCSLLLFYQNDL